ncbi:Regulator of G-protein signaling 22 [Trichoplax sp. H2]|nr:Regulator of G-protein signaling 22 [Trichoplax sp. H2]|eukprot:RDD42623.1 Regulator of G-protein signaling 22 [Trichoplax sp. H2]
MGKYNDMDITAYNFHQMLLDDPLLADYYNAFLRLPVFGQKLQFEHQSGTLCKPDPNQSTLNIGNATKGSQQEIPTVYKKVTRREAVFNWNIVERLPYFLRTRIYQEYKLCKLLIKRIDMKRGSSARHSANSRRLGGYSCSQSNVTSKTYSSTTRRRLGSAPGRSDDIATVVHKQFARAHPSASIRRRPQSSIEARQKHDPEYQDVNLSDIRQPPVYKRPKSGAFSLPPMLSKSYSKHSQHSTKSSDTYDENQNYPTQDDQSYDGSGNGKSQDGNRNSSYQKSMPLSADAKASGFTSADTGLGTMLTNSPSKTRRSQGQTRGGLTTAYDSVGHIAEEDEQLGHGDFEQVYGQDEEDTIIDMTDELDQIFDDIETTDEENDSLDGDQAFSRGSVIDFSRGDSESLQDTQRTEADIKSLADKWKMSLHDLKVQILGSLSGMSVFKNYLSGTTGESLFQFWLDVEYYKEKCSKYLHDTKEWRLKLVREIEDKYKSKLTDDAKAQIRKAKKDEGISHTLFAKAQYDILRRLRSYWCNRFLLHVEKVPSLRAKLKEELATHQIEDVDNILKQRAYQSLTFLPTLSPRRNTSAPLDPFASKAPEVEDKVEFLNPTGTRGSSRKKTRSAGIRSKIPFTTEIFIAGLSHDTLAGDPFIAYLERQKLSQAISICSFWKEISSMESVEELSSNRRYQLSVAWSLWKRFINKEGECYIGATTEEEENIRQFLQREDQQSLYSAGFYAIKARVEEILRNHWKDFYETDIRGFLEVEYGTFNEFATTPSHTPRNRSRISFRDMVTVYPSSWKRRPDSTASERGVRLHRALTLADDNNYVYMALKNAKYRMNINKRKLGSPSERTGSSATEKRISKSAQQRTLNMIKEGVKAQTLMQEKDDDQVSIESHRSITRPLSFISFTDDKLTMDSFKNFIQKNAEEKHFNKLLLYLDIEVFKKIPTVKKSQRKVQSYHILKVYIKQDARRNVLIPDKLYNSIKKNPSNPPKEEILIAIQDFIRPQLDNSFKKFMKVHLADQYKSIRVEPDEDGKEPEKRPGSTTRSIVVAWKNRRKGRGKTPGRIQPIKVEKESFLQALQECAAGKLTIEMEYFKRFLSQCGEEDGFPFLVNDLCFWLEIQKYKEMAIDYSDEHILRGKANVIVECYLLSQSPPPVQVDVTPEIAYRIVQSFRYSRNFSKDMRDGAIFDDAQACVFRELLMYWAGFQQQYIPPQPGEKQFRMPWYSKQQKMMIQRYKDFQRHIPIPLPVEPLIPDILDSWENLHLSFTLSRGVRWRTDKELQDEESSQTQGNNFKNRPAAHLTSSTPSSLDTDFSL